MEIEIAIFSNRDLLESLARQGIERWRLDYPPVYGGMTGEQTRKRQAELLDYPPVYGGMTGGVVYVPSGTWLDYPPVYGGMTGR